MQRRNQEIGIGEDKETTDAGEHMEPDEQRGGLPCYPITTRQLNHTDIDPESARDDQACRRYHHPNFGREQIVHDGRQTRKQHDTDC